VGFSNGWALLTPYQPPPLVNSCLQDSNDATGPTGMLWVVTSWLTMTGTFVVSGWPLSSSLGVSTITAIPLARTGWPFASSCGAWTVTAIFVVITVPLA